MTDLRSWNESEIEIKKRKRKKKEIEIDTVFSVLFLKWKNKNAILSQLKVESYNEMKEMIKEHDFKKEKRFVL